MTYLNRASYVQEVEKCTLPSETVPGMTLGMRELLDRYVRGDHVERYEAQWGVSDDIPHEIDRMDKQDQLMMARQIRESIEDIQKARKRGPGPSPQPPAPPPLPGNPAPQPPVPQPSAPVPE